MNEIGLYEIFLEVVDKVGEGGNIRLVRWFIFFDNILMIFLNENKLFFVIIVYI